MNAPTDKDHIDAELQAVIERLADDTAQGSSSRRVQSSTCADWRRQEKILSK